MVNVPDRQDRQMDEDGQTDRQTHTHTHTQTLDLLFKMTNPMNVVVIADRLIGYLRQTRDEYIRSDLVARITQLAERFAPDNQWFLQTMNAVFELGECM